MMRTMQKYIITILLFGLVLPFSVNGAEELKGNVITNTKYMGLTPNEEKLKSLGLTPFKGPLLITHLKEPDAVSVATYIKKKTYIELLEQAAKETLTLENYTFFMGISEVFKTHGSGSQYTFDVDKHFFFYQLCTAVLQYTFPETTLLKNKYRQITLPHNDLRCHDLSFAVAAIKREANMAKEKNLYS